MCRSRCRTCRLPTFLARTEAIVADGDMRILMFVSMWHRVTLLAVFLCVLTW